MVVGCVRRKVFSFSSFQSLCHVPFFTIPYHFYAVQVFSSDIHEATRRKERKIRDLSPLFPNNSFVIFNTFIRQTSISSSMFPYSTTTTMNTKNLSKRGSPLLGDNVNIYSRETAFDPLNYAFDAETMIEPFTYFQ